MKKKIFNSINVVGRGGNNSAGCWVRVHNKGCITFSKAAVEGIGLQDTGFVIVQDEDRPQDWYIEKSNEPVAFKLRTKEANKWDKTYLFQSSSMAREILSSLGIEKSARFMMSIVPNDDGCYAIITKSAKSKTMKAA